MHYRFANKELSGTRKILIGIAVAVLFVLTQGTVGHLFIENSDTLSSLRDDGNQDQVWSNNGQLLAVSTFCSAVVCTASLLCLLHRHAKKTVRE